MNKVSNKTPGGRVLNFNRALHTYEKERYFKPEIISGLPENFKLDLSKLPVFDQGQEGSCTANAWANLYDYRQVNSPANSQLRFHPEFWAAARNFIYGQERLIDGDFGEDNGSYLHTGAQVLALGTVSEKVFAYGPNSLYQTPSPQIFTWAHTHKLTKPSPVQLDPAIIMATLAAGNPIVFGMPVYNEFEGLNASNYILRFPSLFESPLGGHANMLFGYEMINGQRYYWDLNSWGAAWGLNGTCLIPERFVLRFFSDLWTAVE